MSAFTTLTAEALRDAIRRRIVAAIIAISILSLMAVDGCTSCAGGEIVVNGQPRSLADIAGATGVVLFVTVGLWIITLAGILASDHLQQTLEDGSANLSLARPVSRGTFALARLAGALAVALLAGAVLLGGTAILLHLRSGLPLEPALAAGGQAALGAFVCGALAMTVSLSLPRLATMLLVFGCVGMVALANLVVLTGQAPENGLLVWIDRLGPPLATSLVVALDPWVQQVQIQVAPIVGIRMIVWCGIAYTALITGFRRLELGR